MSSHRIIVFTLNGCGHCVDLKKSLNDLSIPYNEIEVGQNQQIWDKVVEQTGHNSLPTVYIGLNGGDEGPVFVPGRDYENKNELLEKIKQYI